MLRALRGDTIERPPVWMMRQAGRYMKVRPPACWRPLQCVSTRGTTTALHATFPPPISVHPHHPPIHTHAHKPTHPRLRAQVYQDLCKTHKTFRERSENVDVAVEVSLQPWRAFQPDGVILFSDILTPITGMNIPFDIVAGKGPVIFDPIRTAAVRARRDRAAAISSPLLAGPVCPAAACRLLPCAALPLPHVLPLPSTHPHPHARRL